MGRGERVAVWAAFGALLLATSGVGAQDVPEPSFDLRPGQGVGPWTVDARVPPGWALYAPEAGLIGLPLTGRWIDAAGEDHPAALDGPQPVEERYSWGSARVHRGRVRLTVTPPPAAADVLELHWALCRPDLCVPGRTRLAASRDQKGPRLARPSSTEPS